MNKMIKLIKPHYLLITATIIALIFAIIYVITNSLANYDASGHLFAVEKGITSFPSLWSWDSQTMLGWHQGYYHPMGLHWLMSALGLMVGAAAAIKTFVFLAIIALPISIYFFTRSLNIKTHIATITTLAILAALIILPDYLATGFSGLINTGLIPAFISLPILFFALGFFEESFSSKRRSHVFITIVLFALLAWSHLVAALIAALYVLSSLFLHHKLAELKVILIIGLGTILLALPLLLHIIGNLASDAVYSTTAIAPLSALNLAALALAAILIIVTIRRHTPLTPPLIASAVLICLVVVIPRLPISLPETFHVYRLQPFAWIFLGLATIQQLQDFIKSKRLIKLLSILSVALLLGITALKFPRPSNFPTITATTTPTIDGRFIEDFRRTESYPATYAYQFNLLENENTSWARGLFHQSAPNMAFTESLARSLRPYAFTDAELQNEVFPTPLDSARIPDAMRLFGISYILSLSSVSKDSIASLSYQGKDQYYHLTNYANTPLAEVWPGLEFRPIDTDWSSAIKSWWTEPGSITYIPYDSSTGHVQSTALPTQVDILEFSDHRISLNIHSSTPQPVIIKASYSPLWHANQPIPIIRLAPHLMLIEASSQITLTIK